MSGQATITSMGGGGRDAADLATDWLRLESQPLRKDLFAGTSTWKRRHKGVPFFVWPMLAASVLAISSAGAAFEQMLDVSPLTLAAWRLQFTSVLLMIGAAWQWHKQLDVEQRRRVLGSWKLLSASGVCLAMHFGFWVWSLHHTSLTHSLLFVCCVPVLIALGTWLLRQPISWGELLGSAAGFSGGLLLALGPKGSKEEGSVSVAGDFAALLGAIVFIGYLQAGRTLRQWMPIFVYAFPVTSLAAQILSVAAVVFEDAQLFVAGKGGVMGWVADKHYVPWIMYLSMVPGIVGHTGFNALLKYLTPLTVSLAFQLEPLIGTLIGWMVGVVAAPGWATWLGGAVVLGATCVVTAATAQREARQEARGQAYVELENVLVGEEKGLLASDDDDDASYAALAPPKRPSNAEVLPVSFKARTASGDYSESVSNGRPSLSMSGRMSVGRVMSRGSTSPLKSSTPKGRDSQTVFKQALLSVSGKHRTSDTGSLHEHDSGIEEIQDEVADQQALVLEQASLIGQTELHSRHGTSGGGALL